MFKIGDIVKSRLSNGIHVSKYVIEDIMHCEHCNEQFFLEISQSRNDCETMCVGCRNKITVWGGSRPSRYYTIVDTSLDSEYLKKLELL